MRPKIIELTYYHGIPDYPDKMRYLCHSVITSDLPLPNPGDNIMVWDPEAEVYATMRVMERNFIYSGAGASPDAENLVVQLYLLTSPKWWEDERGLS